MALLAFATCGPYQVCAKSPRTLLSLLLRILASNTTYILTILKTSFSYLFIFCRKRGKEFMGTDSIRVTFSTESTEEMKFQQQQVSSTTTSSRSNYSCCCQGFFNDNMISNDVWLSSYSIGSEHHLNHFHHQLLPPVEPGEQRASPQPT